MLGHLEWEMYQAEEQRMLFSGLYMSGYKVQTDAMRQQRDSYRTVALAMALQKRQAALRCVGLLTAANSPRYGAELAQVPRFVHITVEPIGHPNCRCELLPEDLL